MNEAQADYEKFYIAASDMLPLRDRTTLQEESVKALFSMPADHPTGYYDGVSNVDHDDLIARMKELSDAQRESLYRITRYVLEKMPKQMPKPNPKTVKELLLGTNQLLAALHFRPPASIGRKKIEESLEELLDRYSDNAGASINEWEAQKAENKGYWHAENMNGNLLLSLFSTVGAGVVLAGTLAATGFKDNSMKMPMMYIIENITFPGLAAAGIGQIAERALLVLQNIGRSPAYDGELVAGRHYGYSRHPLYGMRMLSAIAAGIASLNPLGAYFAIKSVYHGTRACEEQDKRLRILYGNKAEEFQQRVPMVLPGSNFILKGLDKIIPARCTAALRRPISHYLSKIPLIREEPELNGYVGTPNSHIGSGEQQRARFRERRANFLRAVNPSTYLKLVKSIIAGS